MKQNLQINQVCYCVYQALDKYDYAHFFVYVYEVVQGKHARAALYSQPCEMLA